MKGRKISLYCPSCSSGVEFYLGEPPCEVLRGWITISRWKGSGSVEHLNFCSLSCLQQWVNAQLPQIPEVFVKCFEVDST